MFVIDEEFRKLIPPLSTEEYQQLEQNILADGCRDALVVWADENILLDGHNRYEICKNHGIYFRTVEIELADRDAAQDWIDTNQIGRRNLTPDGAALLRGRIGNRQKNSHGGAREASGNSCHLKTREELADRFGVSPRTIQNDMTFASAVEELRDIAPELKQQIISGDAPARSAIIEAAKVVEAEPEKAKEILQPKNILHSSVSSEWYTPAEYVNAARELMNGGIDLDPASCEFANRVVCAARFLTSEDNGLAHEWNGRVWLNPPYGKSEDGSQQEIWSRYLLDQYKKGNCEQAVLLVTAAPGNKWFAPLWDFPICFPDHRIRFYDASGKPSQPTHSNALVYIGTDIDRFHAIFSKFGVVAVRYDGVQ